MSLRHLTQRAIHQCSRQIYHPFGTSNVRYIHHWVQGVLRTFNNRREFVERRRVYPKKPSPRSEFSDWNYNSEIYAFGRRLNEDFDDSLLRVAFTDQSYVTIELERQKELGIKNLEEIQHNETLAVEGIHFIKKNIMEILAVEFPLLPKQAALTLCNWLTKTENLASIANFVGTKDLILSNDYPPSEEMSSRTLHAIVSVLEKSSGPERARRFVIDIIMTQLVGQDIYELLEITTPWTLLKETLREHGQAVPEPRIIFQVGQNTILGAFGVGLYDIDKKMLGKGFGETLDIAQEEAAKDVLRDLYGLRRPKSSFNCLTKGIAAKSDPNMIQQSQQKVLN